jgi:hypothetical protein
MIVIADMHVHFYKMYSIEEFFKQALSNFRRHLNTIRTRAHDEKHHEEAVYVLCLTETKNGRFFHEITAVLSHSDIVKFCPVQRVYLIAKRAIVLTVNSKETLVLFPGRQHVTEERIELLSLFHADIYLDPVTLDTLYSIIKDRDGIPILPWGQGKWLFRRGEIIKSFLKKNRVLLCDHPSRKSFFALNTSFSENKVVYGSDPLPFVNEEKAVASYCGYWFHTFNIDAPVESMKEILKKKACCIGDTMSIYRAFYRLLKSNRLV